MALDDQCARDLNAMGRQNIEVVSLSELEADEPRLLNVKGKRNRVEYYFTCGPAFLDRIFRCQSEIRALTYVDADFCFYSSPEPVYDELAQASVGLVEHRFSARNQKSLAAGRFNVGWLFFRADSQGRAAVSWWKERCLEWCFDRFEDGKYADQKYLEEMSVKFGGVHSVQHPGVNAAPWNVDAQRFSRKQGQILVNGRPLVAFHVAGIKQLSSRVYQALGADYGACFWGVLRRDVYRSYLRELVVLSGDGRAADQLRYGDEKWGRGWLRMLKHAVWNGSYFFNLFGRIW